MIPLRQYIVFGIGSEQHRVGEELHGSTKMISGIFCWRSCIFEIVFDKRSNDVWEARQAQPEVCGLVQ